MNFKNFLEVLTFKVNWLDANIFFILISLAVYFGYAKLTYELIQIFRQMTWKFVTETLYSDKEFKGMPRFLIKLIAVFIYPFAFILFIGVIYVVPYLLILETLS